MKKALLTFLLCTTTALTLSPTVYAAKLPSGDPPAPVTDSSGSGGGGEEPPPGDDGGEEPPPQEPVQPREPQLLTYTPVVTALHSLNAILADEGTAVYFMPQLQDFPVDLVDSCADITTEDGAQHKFAVVYDGYFDTEVEYNLAQNDNTDTSDVTRLQTSKKVYSQSDNSRALNLLGYDLLLSDERATIVTQGEFINADYYPTLVGTAPLTTKTIVMDLYKAMGVYEWDIKVVFGIDESLDVNTSPIMQQIAVLTNDKVEGGIDTKEGATYVWASRTNPDQYWTRCKRDAIFDGGAHKYTKSVYIGNETSVSFSKNETQTMTMSEFCQVARAIMELYGEPVLTEQEIEMMIQTYALTLPINDVTEEEMEAIRYLAAKGIIDPSTMSWTKSVTFADIEEVLLRIADPNSRLTFKYINNPDSTMIRAGYAKVPIADADVSFESVEEIINPFDSDYYDYYIEAVDGFTNFYLNKLSGIDLTQQDNLISPEDTITTEDPENPPIVEGDLTTLPGDGPPTGEIPVNPIIQDGKEYAFACDKLVVAGADNIATTAGSGYFEYLGLQKYADRYYYHFQISRDLDVVTIRYDVDPTLEKLLDITEYTLQDADGGVYNFSDDLPPKLTFDQAIFSDEFIDREREEADYYNLAETEAYLGEYNWIKVDYKTSEWDKMVKGTAKQACILEYKKSGQNIVVSAIDLEQARGTGERRFEDSGGNVWWIYESPHGSTQGDYITLICQTKISLKDFKAALAAPSSKITDSAAYYRAEDGTVLASYTYLKQQGLCNNLQSLKSGAGILLTTTGGNVSLRTDLGLIIVGDTAIPSNGEMLFYQEGSEYYINVKACMGWSNDYVIVNNQSALIPLLKSSIMSRFIKKNTNIASISSPFPSSTVSTAYSKLDVVSQAQFNGELITGNHNGEGFSLTGTNPLGCYIVVYDPNGDTDYLFVWHRNKVKASDGSVNTIDQGSARSHFKSLTGVDISSVSSNYSLKEFQLNRNNSGNPAGVKYLSYDYRTRYADDTAVIGYVYQPPSFNNVNDALKAYVSGSDSCAIPIAKVQGAYVNLNLNTCTDMEGNAQLQIGTLPMYLDSDSKSNANKMGVLQANGRTVKESSATYDNLDSVKVLASPVGLFQVIKGLGTRSVAQWTKNSGTVYFGSSKCTVKNGQLVVKGRALEFDTNVNAICSLLSDGLKSIYVINEDSSSLGEVLEEKLEEIGVIVTDPETLIDWSAYKFHRLVENLDSWTTILLIFVLNILPRIGMLLFFTLMLLSLIKDVKFWRSFCVNYFDVYSFLTMGKQNVDTVDMKRVVFISLICFSIFLIIMDGQLFNFIIFICRLIINITQR